MRPLLQGDVFYLKMIMKHFIEKLVLYCLLTGSSCAFVQAQPLIRMKGQSLREYFVSAAPGKPIIMAHRMSPAAGFAENSLVTLQYNMKHYPGAIQEIDVHITKDGKAVLSHDDSIGRTTTGKGMIKDLTLNELLKYNLKDIDGNVLPKEHIPLLSQALKIIRGKGTVMLDMKPGTDYRIMMNIVKDYGMLDDVVVICYTLDDARTMHKNYPSLMLAVGFNSLRGIDNVEHSGLPFDHLVALVPKEVQTQDYYDRIRKMGVPISFSAQNKTDLLPDAPEEYRKMSDRGISILCTDSIQKAFKAFEK